MKSGLEFGASRASGLGAFELGDGVQGLSDV